MIDIRKAYGDTLALDHVNLEIFAGQILGIVGPNGSGKSTLIGILNGTLTPDAGSIIIDQKEVSFASPADALACRIRSLPQSLELYPSLSVLENIFVGQELAFGKSFVRTMNWTKMAAAASTLLSQVDANHINPRTVVARLSGGQQKAVALARLFAVEARILLFDEPVASLGQQQKTRLLEIMTAEATNGRSIVFISHDIDDLLAVCSRVVVLANGVITKDAALDPTTREELSCQMRIV